jgi:hypothetical protein
MNGAELASTWVFGLWFLGFWQKPKSIFKLEKWVFHFSTTCGAVDTSNRSSVFSYLTDLTIRPTVTMSFEDDHDSNRSLDILDNVEVSGDGVDGSVSVATATSERNYVFGVYELHDSSEQ